MSLFQRQCHGCGQPCDGYYCESCTCPQCGMTLFNGICDNCIYGAGMPIICTTCGGIARGGLCLPCDLREKDLYNYDPNAYSFNNSNYFPQLQDENYLCNLCRNYSHDGYECQQHFPFVYEQEPSYNQNYDDNYYPHESLSYPCCDYCGGSHETFQYQPDNQNVDFSGSDQIQSPQYPEIHHPSQADGIFGKTPDAVTTILPTEEPEHLLSMGYEHLSITLETESDEVTESNAENLLPIPSKCEVTLEDEIECDMPVNDDCSPVFTTFSNPLFKDDDDLDSRDRESLPDEDVPAEEFKIYSNSLFDEDEINSDNLDLHCFNVESDFVKSLLNRDTFIDFSSKFDFSGELAHIKPEIPKFDFDFEEEIRRLIENLLYDNSFTRPPEELNAEIADTIIESIPLLLIPVQDGNSQQEEIDIITETDDVLPSSVKNDNDDLSNDLLLGEADLFLSDDSIPPGIENVDPEGDVCFLEELLFDDFILSHESSDSNFEDNPSISRPPPESPDDNFDLEPEVISAVMEDIDEPGELFNPRGEIFVSTNN
nr:hypothetical protein [Tanacetum cinerariifolium]